MWNSGSGALFGIAKESTTPRIHVLHTANISAQEAGGDYATLRFISRDLKAPAMAIGGIDGRDAGETRSRFPLKTPRRAVQRQVRLVFCFGSNHSS